MLSIDYIIPQFLEKVCSAKEGSSVDEIETFIQKYGTKSEVSLPKVIGNTHIHKKVKNIKNVKRCRDGMPKSMQTR